MKKRICLLICLAFLFLVSVGPAAAAQLPAVDPEHPCSLTLHYDRGGAGYSGLSIRIFRVAEFFADGSYGLTGDFAGYQVKIHEITAQKEWQDAARTLISYVEADGLAETAGGVTDDSGTVFFDGLKTGLYLVEGTEAETESGSFRFESFLIFLPTPSENGEPDYDMEAEPKPGAVTPISRYKVVKLWKDSQNPEYRPESVSVEILCDGELHETVTLNAENNWSYSWQTTDADSRWTVAEQEVPAGYTVAVELKGDTFFVTNTCPGTPQEPPETGDGAMLGLSVLTAILSGLALAAWTKRGRV